jgi:hypothetical protein
MAVCGFGEIGDVRKEDRQLLPRGGDSDALCAVASSGDVTAGKE